MQCSAMQDLFLKPDLLAIALKRIASSLPELEQSKNPSHFSTWALACMYPKPIRGNHSALRVNKAHDIDIS